MQNRRNKTVDVDHSVTFSVQIPSAPEPSRRMRVIDSITAMLVAHYLEEVPGHAHHLLIQWWVMR
jgi:hypothetical protein